MLNLFLCLTTPFGAVRILRFLYITKCVCFRPLLKKKNDFQPFWKTRMFTFIMVFHVCIIVAATFVIANSMVHTLYNQSKNGKKDVGPVRYDSQLIRLKSLATTNEEYFKKCATTVACDPNDKYRTYNGSCNNLQNPNWGAALTPFYRLSNAEFSDGIVQKYFTKNVYFITESQMVIDNVSNVYKYTDNIVKF